MHHVHPGTEDVQLQKSSIEMVVSLLYICDNQMVCLGDIVWLKLYGAIGWASRCFLLKETPVQYSVIRSLVCRNKYFINFIMYRCLFICLNKSLCDSRYAKIYYCVCAKNYHIFHLSAAIAYSIALLKMQKLSDACRDLYRDSFKAYKMN